MTTRTKLFICTASLAALASLAHATPTSSPLYGKTVTLSNATTTVVVAPAIGRIIHYSLHNQRNVLWTNPTPIPKDGPQPNWINWGGDKIWPAQQNDWPFIYGGKEWPPQTRLDGQPFDVLDASNYQIVMQSQVDTNLHVVLKRAIYLAFRGSRLVIKNTITRTAPSPWPVQIWSVTQCAPPNYTLLAIATNAPDRNPKPFINLWDSPLPAANGYITNNTALRFALSDKTTIAKAGTIGSWCAAIYDDAIFLQHSDAPPDGCYPDGANLEAFMFDTYTELEILSSATHLKPGKSATSTTIWQLLPPADNPLQQIHNALHPTEQWLRNNCTRLAAIKKPKKTKKADFGECGYSAKTKTYTYFANDGYISFKDGSWVLLATHSLHACDGMGDISIVRASNGRYYTNCGHVCGQLIVKSKQKITSLENFLLSKGMCDTPQPTPWQEYQPPPSPPLLHKPTPRPKPEIPADFYTYDGFRDWWRTPLVYPYQIMCIDTLDNSVSLEKYNSAYSVKDPNKSSSCIIDKISPLKTDSRMLLFEQPTEHGHTYGLFIYRTAEQLSFKTSKLMWQAAIQHGFSGEQRLLTARKFFKNHPTG